jgi:hypothetical protein
VGVWALAVRWTVVRRALLFSLTVGPVLVAINHADAILTGALGPGRWLQIGLTVLVPYGVSTLSSILALRRG